MLGILRSSIIHNSTTITMSFQDTGMGSDEVTLKYMLNAFCTTKAKSMGRGLAMSRASVAAHGGRIWAMPDLDQGATICLPLPVSAEGTV